MTWYKVPITAEQASKDKHGEIQDKFTSLLLTMGRLENIALFSGGWSRSDEFNVYFTPRCAEIPAFKALIDSYDGISCDEPIREEEKELGLLVGDSVKWSHMIWHPDL